jgi:hypothetical protein
VQCATQAQSRHAIALNARGSPSLRANLIPVGIVITDRLHAEGWSYGIAEHLTKQGFSFALMRTAMENVSSLRPMIC